MNQLITSPYEFDFSEQQIRCIEELKKLVVATPNLQIGTENKFLSKYLYFSEWDVKEAFKIINGYFDFKHTHDEKWITHKSPEDFKDIILNTNTRYLLPKFDKNGRYIFIYQLPNVFDRYPDIIDILIELDDLILETVVATRRGQENGVSIIFDVGNFSKSFLKFLTPKHIMILKKKNTVFPLKNRELHIIQTGFMVNVALTIMWPVLGAIFEEKTEYHKEMKSGKLQEMIGYEVLPHEYGGPEENVLDGHVLYNFLLENKEFVKKVQLYKKVK